MLIGAAKGVFVGALQKEAQYDSSGAEFMGLWLLVYNRWTFGSPCYQ